MQATKKHKIFINGRFLTQSISGVQRYAHEIVTMWDEMIEAREKSILPFEFELLVPRRKFLKHSLELKHIPTKCLGYSNGHLWEQLELSLHTMKGILFCPGNTAPIIHLLSNKPTIVTVHDLSFRYFPQAYSTLFKVIYHILTPLIFRFSKAIITVSRSEKASLLKLYPAAQNKVYAIQNGGIPERYLNQIDTTVQLKNTIRKPFLLYVGALNPRKNPQGVIHAFREVQEMEDLSLVIIGSESRTFKQLKVENFDQIIDKIIFEGQVDDPSAIIPFYKSALCLVFPSFYEASPLPPIEAMSCGCPVVASMIPALEERCGDAALYCDPHRPETIAQSIEQIINDQRLRKLMRQRGFERAAQYNWLNCAQETLKIFKTLCTSNSAG
jgi:glycosyltransferase involved in cell wall biosynthesis